MVYNMCQKGHGSPIKALRGFHSAEVSTSIYIPYEENRNEIIKYIYDHLFSDRSKSQLYEQWPQKRLKRSAEHFHKRSW